MDVTYESEKKIGPPENDRRRPESYILSRENFISTHGNVLIMPLHIHFWTGNVLQSANNN